jgi:molybdenum-dependent DNA-binding transcriptional regulator ModE
MRKTTQMLLMEATDPKRRDVREIIAEAFDATGSLDGAAKRLGLDYHTLWGWINRRLDGEVVNRSAVTFRDFQPAEEPQAVAS